MLLAPVLPLINERLGLKLALAGLLGTVLAMCNLTQPFMGIWGDLMHRRNLVIAGALIAAVFIPLLGVAPNFATLVAVLTLGGLGISAFHPQAFTLAGELSNQRRAFGVSLFAFGGTLGIGLTPLWVPLFTETFGLHALPFVSIPGILAVILVSRFVSLRNPRVQRLRLGAQLRSLLPSVGPLSLITAIVVLRTITFTGFGFFLTLLGRERGLSLVESGIPLGVYNLAGVLGSLVAGYMADRWNAKRIIWISILLSSPALLAFLQADGYLGYFWIIIGGFGIMSSNSILVVLAQELAPENISLASSLPLGFSWGLAAFSLPFIGHLADHSGIATTLHYLALLPVLTAVLALYLPERPPH